MSGNSDDHHIIIKGSWLLALILLYLSLPTCLFLFAWCQPWVAMTLIPGTVFGSICIGRHVRVPDVRVESNTWLYFVATIVLGFVWLGLTGITGIVQQNGDYIVRNGIYHSLIYQEWNFVNEQGQPFIYYLAFWLVPALVCKVCGITGLFGASYVLSAWVAIGLLLMLGVLWTRFGKNTFWFLVLFMLQGSLSFLFKGILAWSHVAPVWIKECDFFKYSIPTLQLNFTFHHTTLIWLVVAMFAAWRITAKYRLFLVCLCLFVSPLGSLGLAVYVVVQTVLQRIPIRRYFGSWSSLVAVCIGICALTYFGNTNGHNSLRFTWQDNPLADAPMWEACAMALWLWFLQVGVPMLLLYKPFKKSVLYWAAACVATLLHIVYVGSLYANNELSYKASTVCYFCWAVLFMLLFTRSLGTKRLRILCMVYIAICSVNHWHAWSRVVPTLAFESQRRIQHMKLEWRNTLEHPEHPFNPPLWGKPEPGILYRWFYRYTPPND